MVQGVGSKSQYGAIQKVGSTDDGRVVYQVVGSDGKVAGGLSVAQKDCDTFERSYNSIMNAAPKLEEYMKTHSEEDIKNLRKKGRRITGIGALIGGLIPAFTAHRITENGWIQAGLTLVGTIAGLIAGGRIGAKITTPPGAKEMTIATQAISKLDIQPLK